MSQATGPLTTLRRDGGITPLALAAAKVYKGAAAAIVLGVGFGTPLVPATVNHVFVGVFGETYDNSGGSAGGYFTQIIRNGCHSFSQTGTAITAASIGEPVYFSDDNTVTLTSGTTYAGIVAAVDVAGNVWVDIESAVQPALNSRNNMVLSGAADAINPHVSGTYLVSRAGVDAMTLAAPTAGTDDGVEITLISTTANAHTLTATGLLKTGSASVNVATFAAFAGAGLTLRANNGLWYTKAPQGITYS